MEGIRLQSMMTMMVMVSLHSAKLQLNISTLVSLEKFALISGIKPNSRPLSLIGQKKWMLLSHPKENSKQTHHKNLGFSQNAIFEHPQHSKEWKKNNKEVRQPKLKQGEKKNKAEAESKEKVIHHCSSKFEKKGKETANLRRWASRECRRCIQREQKSKPPTSTCASSTDSTNNPNLWESKNRPLSDEIAIGGHLGLLPHRCHWD